MQELLPGSVLLVKYIPSDEDGSDYENSDEDMDEDMDEDSDVESGPCMAPDGSVLTECSCFYPYGMLHLRALATLEPATIAQHADGVVAMLAADEYGGARGGIRYTSQARAGDTRAARPRRRQAAVR